MKKLFGSLDLNKTEELDDGTIKVWGIASAESLDSDGEIITAEAMKNAIDGYMKFGAIREMHGSNAAGTALEIYVDLVTGFTHICALIVDPIAILKIKTGVYKAWSIGGKALKRIGNKITELILVEISLVDRPANSDAIFTMYKNETIDNEQQIVDNVENIGENMTQENNQEVQVENQEVIKEEISAPVIAEETDIKKSLSDIGWLADILSSLKNLQQCMEWEKEWEDDKSKIPDDLREVIKQLANILVATAQEETQEVVSEKSDDNTDIVKNEKLDESVVAQIYALALQLQPKDLNKAEVSDELAKFEETKDNLTKALQINDELTKRVKELEAMPQSPKAVLSVVNKEGDASVPQPTAQDRVVKNEKGEVDEVATAILKAQQNPSFIKI